MFKKNDRVLVIAAHPDDEVLGAGGVIALAGLTEVTVDVIFVTEGTTSRDDHPLAIGRRQGEAFKAAGVLGIGKEYFYGYPDQMLERVPLKEVADRLSAYIKEIKPTHVFTHNDADVNQDHRWVHNATLVAMRRWPAWLLAYPVISSPQAKPWRPNLFVDITPVMNKKIKAMECYQSEMTVERSEYGIQTYARFWGMQQGLAFVEPFELIKVVL